jgi:peroxiredoxin
MEKKSNLPVLAVSAVIVFLLATSASALDLGQSAPPFASPTLDGTFVFSKNVLGKGWVLLDFFETTCEPCKRELPELNGIAAAFAGKGLKAFLLAGDVEGTALLAAFFASQPTRMTVLVDRYKITAGRYGVKVLPTLYLIDPGGRVALKTEGYSADNVDEIRAILTRALAP